ncbi:wax ester/triacylglycerol synthase family O-acyltransferase [Hydrogenophaga defluvii]|uniref:diacylglycerol O-acyltransferase n=1 Tax=Hydrogenophaga defluvii TaxID=249410 RepID=A0ABW2SAN8_9BURK
MATRLQKSVARAVTGTLGLRGERMSKVDTAWLRMDSPANLMMIVGVWVFRPGVDFDALCERLLTRLSKYPRFLQRVVEDAAGATWVRDRDFDIHHHVRRGQLKRRRGQSERAALQARVAELAMRPLDRRHPLWDFELIETYDGGSAMIARIHHCIGDGIALISVMMSLFDGGLPPPERRKRASTGPTDDPLTSLETWLAGNVLKPLTGATVKALNMAGDGAARSLDLLSRPQEGLLETIGQSADLARLGGQVLSDLAELVLMPDDSPTGLKGLASPVKRVAWCEPVPLDHVKAIGKALGCSVNDVLLTCVAGALGAYLQDRGEETAGKEIRAMVPVNLRPLDQAWQLGNRFGLVPLVLPLGLSNPVERLYEVKRRMNGLKGSTQPLLVYGVLSIAGTLAKPVQDLLLALFHRKTTAVMTNVPGPVQKLQLCGATLEQNMFWVPASGDIGVGVSILSYGGGVQFGLITDAGLCPDPQQIIDRFEPEFQKLLTLSLMLPWGLEG